MLGSIILQPILFASGASGAQSFSGLIFFLGLLIVIWYVLIIRPQGRNRRKTQEMIARLKTGDRVVTNGGILGTVVGFGSNTVQVQITAQVKIEVLRSMISGLQPEEHPAPGRKQEEPVEREPAVSGKVRK